MSKPRTRTPLPDGYISEDEAAARIGVDPVTLKTWRKACKAWCPPRINLGTVAYNVDDLETWIASRTVRLAEPKPQKRLPQAPWFLQPSGEAHARGTEGSVVNA